jgi:hypothetical protein
MMRFKLKSHGVEFVCETDPELGVTGGSDSDGYTCCRAALNVLGSLQQQFDRGESVLDVDEAMDDWTTFSIADWAGHLEGACDLLSAIIEHVRDRQSPAITEETGPDRFTGPLAEQLEAVWDAGCAIGCAHDEMDEAVAGCEKAAKALGLSPDEFARMLEDQVLDIDTNEAAVLRRIEDLDYRAAAEELHYENRPIPLKMYRKERAEIAERRLQARRGFGPPDQTGSGSEPG